MLVLTRKVGEEIVIGRIIRLKVLKAGTGRIRLRIAAPDDIVIDRAEVDEARNQFENRVSAASGAAPNRARAAADI